jgi:hypothetical protein
VSRINANRINANRAFSGITMLSVLGRVSWRILFDDQPPECFDDSVPGGVSGVNPVKI